MGFLGCVGFWAEEFGRPRVAAYMGQGSRGGEVGFRGYLGFRFCCLFRV